MFAEFSSDSCLMLAEIVVALHFAVIAFVVLGQLVILTGWIAGWRWIRNFWFRIIHFLTIVVIAVESICDFPCPLTVWEDELKTSAGMQVQDGSFIGRWMHQMVFFDDLAFNDWKLRLGYIIFAAAVVVTFVFAPPKCPRCKSRPVETLPEPAARE